MPVTPHVRLDPNKARSTAEEAPPAGDERLQLALDAAQIGTFLWHAQEDRSEPDARMLEILGLPPGSPLSLATMLGTVVHPDDRARCVNAIAEATDPAGTGELREELRIVRPNGAQRWVAVQARTTFGGEPRRALRMFGTAVDVTERREAAEALERDLADAALLQRVSSQLIQENDEGALYDTILDAALALASAPMGSIQLLDRPRGELELLAWRGFHPASAAFWQRVRAESACSCGAALERGARVVVTDVETCDFMAGTQDLAEYRRSGGRSVQTTPLVARNGRTVGMLSTHWREVHEPTERELRLLDVLARQAADLIERRTAERELRRSEELARLRSRLADALRPLADPVAIQGEAARLLAEHLAIQRVMFGEVETDDRHFTIERDFADGLPSFAGRYELDAFGPLLVEEARGGRTVVVADAASDPRLGEPERATYAAGSVRSAAVALLVKEGRLTAFLGVHGTEPRAWTEAEVEALEDTAERTWAALERARAEAQARHRDRQLEALVASIDEGFCVCEMIVDEEGRPVDYRFLETNPLFEEMTGLRGALGRTAYEQVPDLEPRWVETYARVGLGGETLRFEDGSEPMGRWFDVFATPVPPRGRFAIVFRDITGRRRERERERFLAALGDALRPLSDPGAILLEATRLLGKQLGVNRALYAEIEGESAVFKDGYAEGLPPMVGRFPIDAYCGKAVDVLRRGESLVIAEVATDALLSDSAREGFQAAGVAACMATSLLKDGRWVASFGVHSAKPRQWSAAEVALVQETAERTWAALERGKAEAALRESEERFRELVEVAPQFVWVSGPDGVLEYVNRRWRDYSGLDLDVTADPQRLAPAVHPDDRAELFGRWEASLASGEVFEMQARLRSASGEFRWFLVRTVPLRNETGAVAKWFGISTDIHQQHRAAEAEAAARREAERSRDQLRRLQELTAALAGALTPEEVASLTVGHLSASLEADASWTALSSDDETALELVEGRGYEPEALDRHQILPLDAPLPLAEAARTRRAFWLSSPDEIYQRYPRFLEVAEQAGAAAIVPFVKGSRALGAFGLCFKDARRFPAAERYFLLAAASVAAEALARARTYALEHELATTLQHSLLAGEPPPLAGAEACVRYRPAVEELRVGGDWYEVLPLAGDRVGLSIGDVVGSGIPAATAMGQLRSAMAALAPASAGPGELLDRLEGFVARTPGARMATVAYAVVDLVSREVAYACAGHPPPLVLKADGDASFLMEGRSTPLGASVKPTAYREGRTFLPSGARLLLYSDGLIERRRETIDDGLERLVQVARARRELPLEAFGDALVTDLFRHHPQDDDVALLCLELAPVPLRHLRVSFPAQPGELAGLRKRLRTWLDDVQVDRATRDDVILACGEACANAIEHAYLSAEEGEVLVEASLLSRNEVAVTVQDRGAWRRPPAVGNRGRGMALIEATMDQVRVDHETGGTVVHMLRRTVEKGSS